jgi:hypothetical protein
MGLRKKMYNEYNFYIFGSTYSCIFKIKVGINNILVYKKLIVIHRGRENYSIQMQLIRFLIDVFNDEYYKSTSYCINII